MKALALAAVLLIAVPAAVAQAAPATIGTVVLDSAPTYGGDVTAHWTLGRRPQLPSMGVICYQDTARYIAELPIARDLAGTGTILLANETSSAMPGSLDYSQPAHCQVWLFDDRRGGREGQIISNVIGFEVTP